MTRAATDNGATAGIIWQSQAMSRAVALADAAASSDACVLIEGESGTGKELFAQRIHARSRRSAGPFIPVNCAGISASLFESQFFGHLRGSFTGASQDMQGIARTATGGTVLLDEVGDIPQDMQAKFLRLLQEQEVMPVGSPTPVRVDTRFLAATATPLATLVSRGQFRRDLYYRMNILRIQLPALRDRPADIPLLLQHYSRMAADRDGRNPVSFSDDTINRLTEYPWPGNVRELVAFVERVYITGIDPLALAEMLWSEQDELNDTTDETSDTVVSIPQAEQHAIRNAMRQTGGNRTQAARLLQINRNTLSRKLQQYDIA
ncbi:MAG: sigma-54 interaction domain-containing protein [Phycisphaerae bacterium]